MNAWDQGFFRGLGLDLSGPDIETAAIYIGKVRPPDLVIYAGSDKPYLYRWHLFPYDPARPNCYLHIQVASDPERPLHDHPWDNTSIILAGGYREVLDDNPADEFAAEVYTRRPGDVIYRKAEWAHRLLLPSRVSYSMSLFQTGPKRREWGFHFPDGWRHYKDVLTEVAGQSHWSPK